MSKVYCYQCKYFNIDSGLRRDYCSAPEATKTIAITNYIYGDYKEKSYYHVYDENYPNKRDTNGCPYYKPKWYIRFFNFLKDNL